MNEDYLSSNSMAMPGEPEVDFNVKTPIWQTLGMPKDGIRAPAPSPVRAELPKTNVAGNVGGAMPATGSGSGAGAGTGAGGVDWASFDFASLEDAGPRQPSALAAVAAAIVPHPHDTAGVSAYLKLVHSVEHVEEEAPEEAPIETIGMYNATETPLHQPKWKTPIEWLQDPKFKHHAGFEEWANWDANELFGADEAIWEEDLHHFYAVQHMLETTDHFLTDHCDVSAAIDDLKYWNRVMDDKLTRGEGERDNKQRELREDIPVHLTPDKHRGVEYSDEVIEMKSKMTLHVDMPPPAILFAQDSFTHNTDFETMNKIGTIREQYSWKPDASLLPHKIDPAVATKIQPVVDFVNHCGRLLSTKDGIIVFEYFGQMRHILGIRDMMFRLARQCMPEIKVSP